MSDLNNRSLDFHSLVRTVNSDDGFFDTSAIQNAVLKTALTLAVVILGACGIFTPASETSTPVSIEIPDTTNELEVPENKQAIQENVHAWISQCYSKRQRIAQLIAVLLSPGEIQSVKPHVDDGELGFIGLVGKHSGSIANSLKWLQQGAPIPVLVGSDEESRYVQRLSAAIKPLPTTAELIKLSEAQVKDLYADYGRQMKALGITINFAPVLDVGYGPGIGTRAYGETPEAVIAYGRAVVQGLQEAGILPVYKHFPGHGSASADSHDYLPTTKSFSEMGPDLEPYQTLLNDNVGVMVGHLLVPGLSGNIPTSLSPPTISTLLRSNLGFNGLVFTDALNMGAIKNTYGTGEAAIRAIEAGADVVMVGGNKAVEPLIQLLLQSVESGRLTMNRIDESTLKVFDLKGMTGSNCTS